MRNKLLEAWPQPNAFLTVQPKENARIMVIRDIYIELQRAIPILTLQQTQKLWLI